MKRSRVCRYGYLGGLLLLAALLQGCNGGAGSSPFITGITLNPATGLVQPGDSVTLTATVQDDTLLKDSRWVASGGTLSNPVGLKDVVWTAPLDVADTTEYSITLVVTQTNGLTDTEVVRIGVQGTGGNGTTSGARITSITTSAATVQPGGTVTLTVSVADASAVAQIGWTADYGQLAQSVGTTVTWIAPADAPVNTRARITATAIGVSGDISTADVTLIVNPSSTTPSGGTVGLITGFKIGGPGAVSPQDTVSIEALVDDTSQLSGFIQWTADGGTLTTDRGSSVQWVAPDVVGTARVYTITATATNRRGEQNSASVRIVVKPRV